MKSRVKRANFPSDRWPSSQAIVFLLFLSMAGIFSVPSLGAADNLSICSPDRLDCERPQVIPVSDLKLNKSYLQGYIGDTGRILTSPVRWDDRDWSAAAIVLSVTAGLYAYDQDLKDWAQRRRNRTTDDLANVFTPFGNGLYVLPAAGLVYLYGEVQESEKAKRIGLLGAESIVLAGAFTGVIKIAGHRHRPDAGDQYNRWDGPGFSNENLSFPSLHASTAFAMATVVAAESDSPCIAPAAYGMASLVALARVNDNEHWSSDVFFGAAVGYFTARAVLSYHKKKNSPLAFLPDISGDRYGVLMLYRF
jgi:membrane-associated phospholipid phosphatase